MFTFADIRNIAIQIEKNGEESYRNAARLASDPEIARVLNWMADEEKCHAESFEKLQSAKPLSAEQQELEAMGKSLLQDMIKGNSFLLAQSDLESAETIMEVVIRSQEFEQDTILFYEFLLSLSDTPETVALLQKIIQEERDHLHRLARMAEKFSAGASRPCPLRPGG